MCKELCEVDGLSSCQDCGTLICWDIAPDRGDDVTRRAYVTSSGDLYCERCGREHDEVENDAEYDDWWDEIDPDELLPIRLTEKGKQYLEKRDESNDSAES